MAAFHEQLAIDSRAISLANSCTADPPGIMSIHYNPAGLTHMPEGAFVQNGITIPYIVKTSKFEEDPSFEGFIGDYGPDPVANTEGTNSSGLMFIPLLNKTLDFLVAPSLGLSSRKPGSRWTFAVGNYAPFAVGLKHDDADDPARYGGKYVMQQHMVYAAPAAAYRFSDTFSMGITVGLGQTAMTAGIDLRTPSDMVAITKVLGDATQDLEIPVISELTLPPPWFGGGIGPYDKIGDFSLMLRDDFSPNFNIGMLWEPKKWFSFGVVYQSEISVNLNGTYRFNYGEQWQKMIEWHTKGEILPTMAAMLNIPTEVVAYQTGRVKSDAKFPQRVQMGFKFQPVSWWKLLLDVHWADWSVLDKDVFIFDQDIQLLQFIKLLGYTQGNRSMVMQRNFEDTIHWSIGMEFMPTEKLTLRVGYEKRPTSAQDDKYDLMYALPDLDFIGAGIGLKLPHDISIDLALGYAFNDSYKAPNDTSTNLNSLDWTNPIYNPYAGLNYEQETYTYMISGSATVPISHVAESMEKATHLLHKIGHLLNPFD